MECIFPCMFSYKKHTVCKTPHTTSMALENQFDIIFTVWKILSISIVVTFIVTISWFIRKSIINDLSNQRKIMYFMIFALIFQLTFISLISHFKIIPNSTKHKLFYYIFEFASSSLFLYPSIMILIKICKDLNKIQTLSHILLFKFISIIFIFLDILSRIYFVLYLSNNYKLNKWIFCFIILWFTIFISLIILLFMIRNESINSFNYIKDVIDNSRKNMLFQQILKLNISCILFLIYCILIFIQINLEIFGKNSQENINIFYLIGLYNQFILANPLLICAILYYLKPTTNSSIKYHENINLDFNNSSQFRLLNDIENS